MVSSLTIHHAKAGAVSMDRMHSTTQLRLAAKCTETNKIREETAWRLRVIWIQVDESWIYCSQWISKKNQTNGFLILTKKTELTEGTQWQLGCRWRLKKSIMGIVSGRKTLQCQINVHDTTSRQSLWRYPKWAFHATALARWKRFLFPYSDCWTNLVKSSNVMKVHVWQFERVWWFGLGLCEPWRLRFCRHVPGAILYLRVVFWQKFAKY